MKNFVAVLCMLMLVSFCNAQTDVNSIIKQTCIDAGRQHKKAFIIFHASWCVWCRRLDSSMNDASCKKYFDSNFIITHLTAFEIEEKAKLNTPGSKEFLIAHHAADQGVPAWFIFDKDENLLADSQLRQRGEDFNFEGSNIGCPSNETEINYFINILNKIAPLTQEESASIRLRFSHNAVTSH